MVKESRSRIQYMEEKLAHVEHDRSRPVTEQDVRRILEALESPDAETRAGALHEVCPCRMPWEIFERLRKPALRLRADPDPVIRGLANHIEEDAREVAALEALRERQMELEESVRGRDRSRRLKK